MVSIVCNDNLDAGTGVPQYYRRMILGMECHGLGVGYVNLEKWLAGGVPRNAAEDIVVVTNQDACLIPPEFAVIAVMHGSAAELAERAGPDWAVSMVPLQARAAKRPRTYWVACSDETAHLGNGHMGVMADRVIFGAVDTDAFYPTARQTYKTTGRPVILHSAIDCNKGIEHIGRLESMLLADYELRRLDTPPATVPDAMRSADMFLCLSVSEGWSLVVAEALATGLVVVSTDVGAYWRSDCPPGYRFRWQERGDPDVVVKAIREAWAIRHLLNGRAWALRWLNLPAFGQKWVECIADAAKKLGVAA